MAERPHGSHAKYALDRCRCDLCRRAQREYNLRRGRAIARPDEVWCPYVEAGPVREHIEWLATCGIGLKSLARLAGVPHGTLSKLVYGDPARQMPRSRRVRPTTARKVMAVMPYHAAGAQRVPAAPTWRLLNELITLGWSRADSPADWATRVPASRSTGPGSSPQRPPGRAAPRRARPPAGNPRKTRWGLRHRASPETGLMSAPTTSTTSPAESTPSPPPPPSAGTSPTSMSSPTSRWSRPPNPPGPPASNRGHRPAPTTTAHTRPIPTPLVPHQPPGRPDQGILVGLERQLTAHFYAGSQSPEPSRGSLIPAAEHDTLLAKQRARRAAGEYAPTPLVEQPRHPGAGR